MAAPNSSSDSMRELEALIAALPRHPRADPSAPNCKIKRTCTPFWYGAEEPDHIRHIFSVYADHLCPEQTAASTQRRRCPMFFIGRISRLAPCTLETDTLAHEPAAKDSERAPPNSGSFLKSSEPHSPSWAGAPRADPFRTLDVVEWFVRDAAPLGEPLNAHHVEYWEVSWNREEGLPESFEKLSKIDFNCRARVSSGPAPCCAPAKCVDCAVASADNAPRAPDCAVSSGLCLCSCACPHRRLRILHGLPVLGTRDEFRYTSDTAPRPVGYLKVAPSRSPSTAYRSPSARCPQSPARMPVVLHSSLVSPSSMAVPTIVQGIQTTRRVMLQSYTITISSLCPSPAGPSGTQAPTLGTLGRSCSALSVDLNLNLEEAEGEGFGGALTVRPVPLPVRCSSAPPATAARSPLGADYGFEWTREEEEAGGIPREEDTEREMDPDVDPQEQEEEEEAAQDQDELGWEFGAEPDDCSAFDNLPFEEDEEEHSEEEEDEEEDEEGDRAHRHVLGHRSPHAHLDPLSRARTREADELAALAAALTRPLCAGSWAL